MVFFKPADFAQQNPNSADNNNETKLTYRVAMEVIREGCGECRASTLLFATTLSKLGLRAAVFTTRVHVIPGVIAGKPGLFYGILIDVDGNILWAERDQPDRKPLFMAPGIPPPTIEPPTLEDILDTHNKLWRSK